MAAGGDRGPGGGFFAAPTLISELPPGSRVLAEEIFGPVLAIDRVAGVEAACEIVDSLPFALTGALFCRNPTTVAAVAQRSPVGNLYVDRETTGAMVARQPFGGNRLSGNGTKAGGADYLLNFVDPRVVCENTDAPRRGHSLTSPAARVREPIGDHARVRRRHETGPRGSDRLIRILNDPVTALAPWFAFSFLLEPMTFLGASLLAFGLSALLVLITWLRGDEPRAFEVSDVILFGLIVVVALLRDPSSQSWLSDHADAVSNVALTIVAFGSLAIGMPFTAPYTALRFEGTDPGCSPASTTSRPSSGGSPC